MESSKKAPAKKATKKASKPSNRKSVKKMFSEKIKIRHTLRREKKLMNIRKSLRNKRFAKTRKQPDFPYENHLTLLIHGANTNKTFVLPHNIEIVTFTLPGQLLKESTAYKVIDTLRNKFGYYQDKHFKSIKTHLFSVTTNIKDTIKINVYNNQEKCPNFPIAFLNDYLFPVQKIFDPETAIIEYDNSKGKITEIEGVKQKLSDDFFNSLEEVVDPSGKIERQSTLQEFVNFVKENVKGSVRIFYLGCASGNEGPYDMPENTTVSFKSFILNSPNLNNGL